MSRPDSGQRWWSHPASLTGGALVTVLPLTTRERAGWLHRVRIEIPGKRTSWLITEQIRTVSATRLTGRGPIHRLRADQVTEVKSVLRQMLETHGLG